MQSSLTRSCSVCSAPSASHLHYGAVTCYSCRAFFRRGLGKPYCCVEGTGDCSIDWTSRRSCQWCRFDKCLKVGMNPELVDASLRLKNLKSRKLQCKEQQPDMIDNLQSLENSGILSEVLRDISNGNQQNDFHFQPVRTFLGDFGAEEVFLLEGGLLPYHEPQFTNSPSTFSVLSPETSSVSSLETSSVSSLETSSVSSLETWNVYNQHHQTPPFPNLLADTTGDIQAAFDVIMDDAKNAPESVIASEIYETAFHSNQTSVIVNNIIDNHISSENKSREHEKNEKDNREDFVMSKSDEEENENKCTLDIETLVEECFLHLNGEQ